jgi:hypothetical protein
LIAAMHGTGLYRLIVAKTFFKIRANSRDKLV